MNRPSRSALLTTGAVLAVLGGLVVTGRWSQGQLGPSVRPPTPSRPPTTTMVAPTGVTQVGLTGPVDDVAVSQDAVWAVTGVRVTRFDDATGRPTAVLTATDVSPPPLVRVTAGPDAVWVAVIGEQLLRVDPKTARVVARLSVTPSAAAAVGAGGVWVTCCDDGRDGRGRLARVDPASNRVTALVELPGIGNAVGAGPAGVWVRGFGGSLWRVDPAANRVVAVVSIPGLGERPGSVAVSKELVWVSDPEGATVIRIDPRRNRPAGQFEAVVGDLTVAADGVVWATSGTRLLRLGRGRMLGPSRDLDELSSVQILAVAAGPDAMWLGTPAGLFRVGPDVLG